MKPILFNTDMVRAILDGRKTCTRRVIKPQPKSRVVYCNKVWQESVPTANGIRMLPPPYAPGDILYVRETWARSMAGTYLYKATDTPIILDRWRPSIHMPKEAARIFLRVKDVRVERLQDITNQQILDEGIDEVHPEPMPKYLSLAYTVMKVIPATRAKFIKVWNGNMKKSDIGAYGWDANPWVWAIEFERREKPEEENNDKP